MFRCFWYGKLLKSLIFEALNTRRFRLAPPPRRSWRSSDVWSICCQFWGWLPGLQTVVFLKCFFLRSPEHRTFWPPTHMLASVCRLLYVPEWSWITLLRNRTHCVWQLVGEGNIQKRSGFENYQTAKAKISRKQQHPKTPRKPKIKQTQQTRKHRTPNRPTTDFWRHDRSSTPYLWGQEAEAGGCHQRHQGWRAGGRLGESAVGC